MPFQIVIIAPSKLGTPTYLTSQIYPLDVIETLTASALPQFLPFYQEEEALNTQITFNSGALTSTLQTYTNGLPEAIQGQISFDSGSLVSGLLTYTNGLPEAIQGQISIDSGALVVALQSYNNYPPEQLKTDLAFNSGTLI